MKTVTIKPGSIMMWGEYGFWTRFWYKIRGKELPYNRYRIMDEGRTLVSITHEDLNTFSVYEPRKPYSKNEQKMLKEVLKEYPGLDAAMVNFVVNAIRPNTLTSKVKVVPQLTKYYTQVYAI